MHASEYRDKLGRFEDAGDGDVVHLGLVVGLVPLEVLDNPKTAIVLLLVSLLDKFLTDCVIVFLGRGVSHGISPVKGCLINVSALSECIEGVKVGISFASGLVDELAALQLNTHRFGGDRGLSEIKLIQSIVDIFSDRDVVNSASAIMVKAVGINLRVVIVDDFRGGMEVVVIDKSHGRILEVTNEDLQSVLFHPG